MKKNLFTLLFGCAIGYGGLQLYQHLSPNKHLASIDHKHNLKSSHKLTLLKAYMMYNKAFLDYGLVQRLDGFNFYQVYFNHDQADTDKITQIYCIFSPKSQLCGHPSIQHGGVSATILDQNTGMLAMLNTMDIAATSQLNVKYLQPIRKGQLYLLKGWIEKKEGKKIWVKATIQDLQTKKKVLEGSTLMVTVKWEHQMAEVFRFLFRKDNTSTTIVQTVQSKAEV